MIKDCPGKRWEGWSGDLYRWSVLYNFCPQKNTDLQTILYMSICGNSHIMNIHSLKPRNPRIYVHVFPFVNQAIDILCQFYINLLT